tara:strand:+ start:19 stop:312 length:294 start_codon:yes stop_codon:yes gene_type:complete
MIRYEWCPGNGTRYDLYYDKKVDKAFIAWMRSAGAGGVCMSFSHYLHYTYIEEKMNIGTGDAVGILKFLETMGHDVGYPDEATFTPLSGKPQIRVLE